MERIETGKIVNTHGIRGELKIQPWADGPESLTGLSVLYLDAAGTRPLEIERARVHQGNVICKFRGVYSIESAQAYMAGSSTRTRTNGRSRRASTILRM